MQKLSWLTIALIYKQMGWTVKLGVNKKAFYFQNLKVIAQKLARKKEWKVIIFRNDKVIDSDIVSEDFAKVLIGETIYRDFTA